MSDHGKRYAQFMSQSVRHIFKNFLNDQQIKEVYECQASEKDPKIAVEISGSLKGEILLNIPEKTLSNITQRIIPRVNSRSVKKHHQEIGGELANMITGTFANQMQFINYTIKLAAPEYNDDPIPLKTFYDNINLSFLSECGGFDIDLYYKEQG